MPFEIDCHKVYAAILTADSIGKNFKTKKMDLNKKLQIPFVDYQC